jgi:hypothetical protein
MNHDMSQKAQGTHSVVMHPAMKPTQDTHHDRFQTEQPICFATHDAFGVLDLGASKTVIGSNHVASLIRSLDENIRAKLSRCPCEITFVWKSRHVDQPPGSCGSHWKVKTQNSHSSGGHTFSHQQHVYESHPSPN